MTEAKQGKCFSTCCSTTSIPTTLNNNYSVKSCKILLKGNVSGRGCENPPYGTPLCFR